MKVCIHRGSKEIGGSCVELESQGQHILIDLGLPLDADENSSRYLPGLNVFDGKDSSFLGILISHPHQDHFGLLTHISPAIPIGMGKAARRILRAAAPFMPGEWASPANGWDYESGVPFDVGPFHITPYLVDHSAYDSYALLVEADGKRLFYSGDFRAHGRKSSLFTNFLTTPPQGIDILLLEGTSIGRIGDDETFPSEAQLEGQFKKQFSATSGLAMVHTSSQNIDRIVSILKASKQSGRRLIIDLYTAVILEATGNKNIPQSDWQDLALFIPQSQRVKIKKNGWFDLLKHHSANRIFIEEIQESPGKYTLLFRPLHQSDLTKGGCLDGASYIYSQWEGYWERGEYDGVKDWLEEKGIQKVSLHTSGHAGPMILKKLVASIKPNKVVPIHSFVPGRYDELFSNVEVHNDGERWEI